MDGCMNNHAHVVKAMIEYERGCGQRIGHFLKVYGYAKAIGELEGLDPRTQLILEAAALMHDVGIKASLALYGDASGAHQEEEGPPVARKMLEALGYARDVTDRVCFLIARHHTYADIDGMDYQILIEADFLVNFSDMPAGDRMGNAKYFRTAAGKHFLNTIYP